MEGQSGKEQMIYTEEPSLQMMENTGGFEIKPCESTFDFEDKVRFAKMELSKAQKLHIGGLMQQIPLAAETGHLAQAYTVSFPQGLPHTLSSLRQGGVGSMVCQDGRFVGSASFHPASASAAFLGAFTAMSVVSGQYFLSQINSELEMIKLNLDKILEFLYGDKKAELMSEVSFVKYAYQNYSSIMEHEQQRAATLVSLQESKKVAMKDIEFYLADLASTVDSKDSQDIVSRSNKAFQMKESLDIALQLYGMSSLLEVYYSQNYDLNYIRYVERDLTVYINKCERNILGTFSKLDKLVDTKKFGRKIDTSKIEQKIKEVSQPLASTGEESPMCKTLRKVLYMREQKAEYYLTNEGDIYLRKHS
ncbi:hypothetical protein AALC25_00195 [Lachnospiraceae bacterium 29-84]